MGSKPVNVSQLNSYIKRILQTDPILANVSVTGEVSNLKFHGSGHVYFSLKDEHSRINCFLASDRLDAVTCFPEEGMEVIVYGYIYLYERGGTYSINIRDMESSGQGELAAAFEKLKRKLEKEGLFDKEHKKKLPLFPEKLAVVTSDTGAAVRDIVKIIKSRNDCVDVLVYPVLVQGPGAPDDISSAIDDINSNYDDVDVIIVGRGGGSMEDLAAFNDENVARSIYASHIPVISAVGHETDFTIADFVADLRAETPTAAANMAVPNTGELREYVKNLRYEAERELKIIIADRKKSLELMAPQSCLRDLKSRIAMEQLNADDIINNMGNLIKNITASLKSKIEIMAETVESSGPMAVMERGYCMVTDEAGSIVKDMLALKKNQTIKIKAAHGSAEAVVTDIGKE